MSQLLINLSPDLKRLQDEGHEVEIRNGHLLVSHIPYVNSERRICLGTLVSVLTLAGDRTVKPDNHVIQFIGEYPCHKNGNVIVEIMHQSVNQRLSHDIEINHSFSNKPPNGYSDYYEKFIRYIAIISSPAKSIEPTVTEKTFKVITSEDESNVFNYVDTNSSRAGIDFISRKLKKHKIAIIGLGGTGSYILDLVAKTPVCEIHLFDGDDYVQHNAFRSPGAPTIDQLNSGLKKVEYFKDQYSRMHSNIITHDVYINSTNVSELYGFDFVFISVDKGDIKELIFDFLEKNCTSFIDVGIGLEVVNNQIIGIIRTSTSTPNQRKHMRNKVSFSDGQDDAYSTNIQIAELNCLNASFAVIKWKKLFGIYQDLINEHHSTYTLNADLLTDDDHAA